MPKLTIAQYAAGSWVISVLRFSTKLWQQNHRGLLPKSHLLALDGLPVTRASGEFYQVDYSADNQDWELYPIWKTDCIDDISLFDGVGD